MVLAVQTTRNKPIKSDVNHINTAITYRIVHSIPGRVRFRVPLLASDEAYALHLETLLQADNRVIGVRINRHAASIAINYQLAGNDCQSFFQDVELSLQLATIIQNTLPTPSMTEEEESGVKLPALAAFLALLGLTIPIPTSIIASVVALAAWPVAKRAYHSLTVNRKLNIDCLDFMAISLTAAQGNLLTPALVMTLHEIGDMIRDRTARVSQQNAADLLDSLGRYAWVLQPDGQTQQIPATDVQINDTVIVYPGEQIPVDGQVLQGKALIDQQKLTGESLPVLREMGHTVYASTLVREGEIYIKTEKVGNATRAGASIELVQQAPVHDTRMGNYAAAIADKAVIPSLIFAGLVLAATRSPARAASILTLDFVTGIRVSLPTTFLAALTHATRHGVLIRSGRALEKLAQVDTLVFDKTGTLTQGNIQVVEVEPVASRISAQRLLELATAAEQRLTHPVAEAVMRYAQEQGIEILPRGQWSYEIGLGVVAEIEGQQVLVGSDRLLSRYDISLTCLYAEHRCHPGKCPRRLNCRISAHDSLLYVAVNGEFAGVISYTDPLRPESAPILQQLQTDYGMEIHLLTGDSRDKAVMVAQELGIPLHHVHAEAFPESKAAIIQQLKAAGKTVGYTGDGLNDSAALAYADASISFGDGSEIARETADVVLMNNNLTSFVDAMAIARETKAVIKQNISLAVVPNLAALGLAATVGMHPLAATVVHNGSAIAAGLNGLRPLMHRDEPQTKK
ncbi:Cd/Co/Hg/Pb/Zn-translocating P-type ATPase [Richelia sinica FACHB-800]|uniref:Cd/Co/Hg/Pb/Zn-translocating P-type ATPase n=1 Tax=Richelia sinica FACHB-800 TaxID=1357546 RepID=A0A975Y2R2_9NOST|nr:heavy metal translocating P-type ATPase [Richelia sinica]MBD2667023.1 heavy metal translocating P-type ATPase [Richelia sinica FACHB-800]QXE21361.1 Cd/Co/Hg/Pb/Zn-translocating P-type ATPase [Richelia sinica FACHB-800]